MKNLHKFTASLVIHWQLVDVATLTTYHFGGSKNPMRPEIYIYIYQDELDMMV